MKFQEIKNNIFYCGLNDCDRRIFDELIPLEHGTSYNSYLVKGSEKTAIIDTMYPPKTKEYMKRLFDNQVGKVDYIIANHGEQDHSGSIPALLAKYPNAIVLTNPKVAENIKNMLFVPAERIREIADGEEVSLGDKTLKFIFAPGVHWPDTMFTYIKEDNVICTCDFLGAHYTFSDVFAVESKELEHSAKRYYAEIMMPFRMMCQRYTKMIKEMNYVTEAKPTKEQINDMEFGMRVVKFVKSNAICIVKDGVTLAVGGGQTSRVWALENAIHNNPDKDFNGAVLASDAFFPFSDCAEVAYNAGIGAIVQPGGSIRDQDSIDFCNEKGIPMVFTGYRHFRH